MGARAVPLVALLALSLLAACQTSPYGSGTSPGTSTAAPASTPATPEVVFPQRLAGLVLESREVYPDPRLGVGYHYEDRITRCSVFVYDRGYGHIPEGSAHEVVRLEFEEARRDIRLAGARGIYADLRELGTSLRVIDTPAGSLSFHRADYSFALRHVSSRSVLMLTGSRGKFLKLRCTWPVTAQPQGRQRLAGFAHAVVEHYLR